MARVYAVIGGVDLDDQGRRLAGAARDAHNWLSRLQAVGVSPRDTRLLVQQGDRRPTRAAFLDALDWLCQRLDQDDQAHGLLILSAHGGRDALFHAADGPLTPSELRAHLPRRGITAILDVCPDPGGSPADLRPQDLVLRAASSGHPAEEHRDGDAWHGAFSWACHRVMDRWMGLGPHGALVPISPRVLVDQATLVLRGLGYGQQPVLEGPQARFDQPLLGGRQVVQAPLRPAVTRQNDPESPDGFKVFDIKDGHGASIGQMIVTGPQWTPATGWEANREYWSIAVPSNDFTLVPTSDSLPGTVPTLKYQHVAFDPSGGTGSYSVGSGDFKIESGGSITGYMSKAVGKLVWFKTATVTTYYPQGTLVFTKLTSSTNITAQLRNSSKL